MVKFKMDLNFYFIQVFFFLLQKKEIVFLDFVLSKIEMDDIEKELELDLENMNIDNVDILVSDVYYRLFLNSLYKYIQCSFDFMREFRFYFRISI